MLSPPLALAARLAQLGLTAQRLMGLGTCGLGFRVLEGLGFRGLGFRGSEFRI